MRQEPHATQLMQIALHHLGYQTVVDGVWGPRSQSAFDDYVSKNGGSKTAALPKGWHRVLATHEEKQQLARSAWLGDDFPGVALPSRNAYGRWVEILHGDKITVAQVVDTGPFCIDDEDYVFGDSTPRAEQLKGMICPTTKGGSTLPSVPDGKGGFRDIDESNGAGIDIFNRVAKELGIKNGDNVIVAWRFVEMEKWPYQT